MSSRLRVVLWGCLALSLLAGCVALVHLEQVHQRSYEWRWSPPAAAAKIQYSGRDYRRSRAPVTSLPVDEVPLGRTEGGGRIYGVPTELTEVVLHVTVEDRTFQYSLLGGP